MTLALRVARLGRRLPIATRAFRASSANAHGYSNKEVDAATAVRITFIDREGKELHVAAPPNKSLLEIAHANDIDLEGACEGSLACSTCHVYLDENSFAKLDEPCDDENDMLDLAFALSEQYVQIWGLGAFRLSRKGVCLD